MHPASSNRELARHCHAQAPAWRQHIRSDYAVRALLVAIVLGATPCLAGAQFGMLKKLKRGPDSATMVNDSLAKLKAVATAVVAPPADTAAPGPSRFQRAKAAAVRASDKFESVTGMSTKDAALAVSGVGVAGIAAKKLGVDPASLANTAMARAGEASQQRSAAKAGSSPGKTGAMSPALAMQGMAGASRGSSSNTAAVQQQMQAIQAMQMMQGKPGRTSAAPSVGNSGYMDSGLDAEIMLAFQQEMMQVAMAAASGDATAQARLDAWTAMTTRLEPEMTALSTTASAGDMNAMVKMQSLQAKAMREWLKGGSAVKGGPTKRANGRKP